MRGVQGPQEAQEAQEYGEYEAYRRREGAGLQEMQGVGGAGNE